MRPARARDALLGLCYLATVLVVVTMSWLVYDKAFVSRSEITLSTGAVGNALQKGSDVKLRGVPVGQVERIENRGDGALITLALEPAVLDELPTSTTARLLPKTLFGERFVSLVVPEGPRGAPLEEGASIEEDSSAEAVEVEQLLDELLPLLKSIQPDKLSATLSELATTLRGNGGDIGATLAAWGDYLAKINPLVPQLADDLEALGKVSNAYADAAPDLLDALATMTTTSATLVDQRDDLSTLMATVTRTADDARGWLAQNSDTIKTLSARSRRALAAIAPYSRTFPCVLALMRDTVPRLDKALGKGTDQRGLHVELSVVDAPRKYGAADAPVQRAGATPRCPGRNGPGSARALDAGGSSGRPARAAGAASASRSDGSRGTTAVDRHRDALTSGGLGTVNSPEENRLIAELMAPTQGLAPGEYPRWSSLLLGPVLRGAEVSLR